MASSQDSPAKETAVQKKHAACDECRSRKLKCSGELTGCGRCVKQGLPCHYSIQKQMGRPPKKRRAEDDAPEAPEVPDVLVPSQQPDIITDIENQWISTEITPDSTYLDIQIYPNNFPGDTSDQFVNSAAFLEPPDGLKPIAATLDPWPDFSTTSASASMLSMSPGFANMPPNIPPSGIPLGVPSCPCLSYLYLCLSTISNLNSFSITQETIISLCMAARTAQTVIRCEICPLSFATGVQNVMMLGTLLSVMADAWFRISQADADTLGRELSSPEFQERISKEDSSNNDGNGLNTTWQSWLRQVLRRALIGSPIQSLLCEQTVVCTRTPDILSLIRELEDRQRQWHASGMSHPMISSSTSEQNPPRCSPMFMTPTSSHVSPDSTEKQQNLQESDFLCLKIIGTSKEVIRKFGFYPSEYPEGVEPI